MSSDLEKGSAPLQANAPPTLAEYSNAAHHGLGHYTNTTLHTPRPSNIGNPGSLGLFSFASTTYAPGLASFFFVLLIAGLGSCYRCTTSTRAGFIRPMSWWVWRCFVGASRSSLRACGSFLGEIHLVELVSMSFLLYWAAVLVL